MFSPGLETFLQALVGLLECSDLFVLFLKHVGGDNSLEVIIEGVARRQEVLVVDELHEGLHM